MIIEGGKEFSALTRQRYVSDDVTLYREKEYTSVAPNDYLVVDDFLEIVLRIQFQSGSVRDSGVNGVTLEDLIIIVIERLCWFQQSEFQCDQNAKAIGFLESALHALEERTKSRREQGIEGISEK